MVVFGSNDNGKTRKTTAAFESFFEQVGKALFLKSSTVVDSENKEHKLAVGIETKGITGTDGRNYLFDIDRLTPRGIVCFFLFFFLFFSFLFLKLIHSFQLNFQLDMNYPGENNKMAVLRFELILRYFETKRLDILKGKLTKIREERQKKAEKKKETEKKETETKEGKQEVSDKKEEDESSNEQPINLDLTEQEEADIFAPYNVNAFLDLKFADSKESIEKDEKFVLDLAKFLKDSIPEVVSLF